VIAIKVECGEFLGEKSEDVDGNDKEAKIFTLFLLKVSASAMAPSAPMLLFAILSVMSV
jgi:hypothetical protein